MRHTTAVSEKKVLVFLFITPVKQIYVDNNNKTRLPKCDAHEKQARF
jgi:hypothetical protein